MVGGHRGQCEQVEKWLWVSALIAKGGTAFLALPTKSHYLVANSLALVEKAAIRDTISLQRIRKLAQPTRSSGSVVKGLSPSQVDEREAELLVEPVFCWSFVRLWHTILALRPALIVV